MHRNVSLDGIHVDEDKVKVVTDWPSTMWPPGASNKVADTLSRKTTLLVTMMLWVLSQLKVCMQVMKTLRHLGGNWNRATLRLILVFDGYLFKENRLCIHITALKSQLIKRVHAIGSSAYLSRDKTISLPWKGDFIGLNWRSMLWHFSSNRVCLQYCGS